MSISPPQQPRHPVHAPLHHFKMGGSVSSITERNCFILPDAAFPDVVLEARDEGAPLPSNAHAIQIASPTARTTPTGEFLHVEFESTPFDSGSCRHAYRECCHSTGLSHAWPCAHICTLCRLATLLGSVSLLSYNASLPVVLSLTTRALSQEENSFATRRRPRMHHWLAGPPIGFQARLELASPNLLA